MKLVILPLAVGELNDAAAFYVASANVELGSAFVAEFDERQAKSSRIGKLARSSGELGAGISVSSSPISVLIIYQVAPDEIRIVAVAHQRRRPAYWVGRR